MNFQSKWKKAKKTLAVLLAVTLFFGGWGNYDFSVLAAGELAVVLTDDSVVYTGGTISLPGISSVKNSGVDVTSYDASWKDSAGNTVSGTVTEVGTYTLTVEEKKTETVTDPETGIETEETVKTGLDGSATFVVEKLNIAECSVTADAATFNNSAITPQNVKVTNKDGVVVTESLYTLGYSNNVNAGDAAITVTAVAGNDNVVADSSITGTFKIHPLNLSSCTVSLDKDNVIYTGSPIEPVVTVTAGNQTLDASFYQVEFENNKLAGIATVHVKPADGNTNIAGSTDKNFTIAAKELTDAMVKISPETEIVTGENFKDVVVVSVEDAENVEKSTLTEGVDYEVAIEDMIVGASYEIKVSGINNYSGEIQKIFALNYATDGTADLNGNTLAKNGEGKDVYADSVTVITGSGYLLSEAVTGAEFKESITYTETPEDYVVYVKNSANNQITEITLDAFVIDKSAPAINVAAPAADSDWARAKEITVEAPEADYGVFYTTEKWEDLVSPITEIPEGMTELDGTVLTITDSIFEAATYYFYAIDNAGHVTEAEAIVNKVEAEVPTLSVEGNDGRLVDGVYWKDTNELVFTVKADDQENLSGLKEIVVTDDNDQPVAGLVCEFAEGALSAEGTFAITEAGTYKLKAVDVAGNESVVTTIEVKEDTQAPAVVLAEEGPTGTNKYKDEANNVYWFHAADVTIPFTVTDELGSNDVETAPYTVVYATNAEFTNASEVAVTADAATVSGTLVAGIDGKTTYYFKVTDKAGNEGEIQSVTVGYDNTQAEISKVELTQLNAEIADEWINLKESGEAEANKTKVAFSVTATDTESGVDKIQYRSDSNAVWQDAAYTVTDGIYTFVTNEAYADGVGYAWEVRVANHVTVDMETATAAAAVVGKIDTNAPSTTAYIRFITDVQGANDSFEQDGDKWSSKFFDMLTHGWNKIWGYETVEFEVYVWDETSGIESITMNYQGNGAQEKTSLALTPVEGVNAVTTGDGTTVNKNFSVFEGEITYRENDGLAVRNFQIDTLVDNAGNVNNQVILGNAADEDIIYLDNVAPVLASVQIDGADVTKDDAYSFDVSEDKELVLTITERFFAKENTPVYPNVVLYAKEYGASEFTPVDDAKITWTAEGVGTVLLPTSTGKEIEYQVTMTYQDPSGNKLMEDATLGVDANGLFTSKTFVFDNVAPELVSYSVTGTGCYVKDASVLKNDTAENANDLVVEFTIDDNPVYYEKSNVHASSQENLIVKLYKEGELVKTLQDGVDGAETLTRTVNGRNHTYSFSYDGEPDTQDKFQVTVEYADVVGHVLADAVDTLTVGSLEDGMYTSEEYIIDHVAPELTEVKYKDAVNVVDAAGEIKGTTPLAGHKAYYNENIDVTLTIDEKYYNVDADKANALDHFEIVVTKDGNVITTPAITWTHEENVHTAAFTIEALKDHSNDGDYRFEVVYSDCAENQMDVTALAVSDENTEDNGIYTSPILVMDTTAPVVTTAYSKNPIQTLEGRDYFKEEVIFTIEVKDRSIRYQELKDVLSKMTAVNVDGSAIDNTQLYNEIDSIKGTDGKHTDANKEFETWTLPLTLSTEANYKIPVNYTDLAGNEAVVIDVEKNEYQSGGYTEAVTVDTQILENEIFVRFTGDITGANIVNDMKDTETTDEGNWISKIYEFASKVWRKLWGNKEIKFDIYLRDEISGIHTIAMQYLDDDDQNTVIPCELTKSDDVKLVVDRTSGIATVDETSGTTYVHYTGSFVIDKDEDLAVSQFKIVEVADKSLNTLTNVNFVDKIYLDAVAPEISIEIQDVDGQNSDADVTTKDKYFYNKAKKLVLTIDERFFGSESEAVYPTCNLEWITYDLEGNQSELYVEEITSNKDTWIAGDDNKYSLTIDLNLIEEMETEYYVILNYADPAENPLAGAKGVEGVVDGTFKSKTFVIDALAPKLEAYSVVGTGCYVEGASVLKNDEAADDMTVNFTINDNPEYFEATDLHDYSQDNLIVKLYKEDAEIKTLSVKEGKLVDETGDEIGTVTIPETGRTIQGTFSYDEKTDPQDKFHVTVQYEDIVGHVMEDGRTEANLVNFVDKNGMYTSEKYIIDHVAPIFDIIYSDATNVVEGNVDELEYRLHSAGNKVHDGKKPVVGYTAYYNDDIQVTLTIDEKYVNVDADKANALEHFEIAVTKDGSEIETPVITWVHDTENMIHTATFMIKADPENHSTDGDYQFVVNYQDCAENKMIADHDSNETRDTDGVYSSPILVMDTTAPVLNKVDYDKIDLFNTVDGKDYVSEETVMTFTMTEKNATPTSKYSITKDGQLIADWSGAESARTTTLKKVEMLNAKGDEQTIILDIVDWAGNKAVNSADLRSDLNTKFDDGTFIDRFTVDTVDPIIKLEYESYAPDRIVDEIDYFKQEITVKVTVDEHNFDETLFVQPVLKTDAKVKYKETEWSGNGDIREKKFTFTADNQYDLSVIGTDNAKNKMVLDATSDMSENLNADKSIASLSVAVDSTIPAIGDKVKPIIMIKPAGSQDETTDGQALYNKDVTYEVVVYDPLNNAYASGIDNITFKVTGEDGTSATCDVNKQGSITNRNGVTVKQVGGNVSNLACGVDNKYTFNVTISSATFNTNGIVLSVGAQDVAMTENEVKVAPIAIDITKPKVVVSYDNNEVTNGKYFHDVRTATITVTERNFSDDCLKFIVNGGDRRLDFSLSKEGNGNRDDAVWVAHYTFGADQDYTVDVEIQDRAKNAGTVDYAGEAPQEFTVDMTKPKITVEYNNHDAMNELYYKEARIATITIEERNFSEEDVMIELTAKNDGADIRTPGVSSWISDGDYHRATIHYDYDGEFTFDIDFMDLATNEADDYEMDHFIVDLTAPELEIFDIEDRSANNDVVAPGVRFHDTNYDADGTVVEMTGYRNGLVEMTGSRTVTANGVEFKLKDFEHVPEIDDMYTMRAIVYDLAGNSSEATVMFSVNRFGSVYTFDDKTDALVGEKGSYYTDKEQEIVVYETNVDTLEFREIILNLNGKLKTLVEGTDFEVLESGNEATWKQYTYQIAEKNFSEEGLYTLTIYSEDRATNVSDNNVKGKKIEFIVDKTKPSVLVTGVEDGERYTEDSREVTIDVEDNVSLGYVEVILNGESTKYDAIELAKMNGKITLIVGSANHYQTLKVKVVDAADNDPVVEELSFLITANLFVQFYMNKPLFYGSLGSLAGLGGLWWFLIGKKKKDEEEQKVS